MQIIIFAQQCIMIHLYRQVKLITKFNLSFKMKTIKAIFAIAIVAASFTACKNQPAEETTTTPMETEAAPAVVDSVAAPVDSMATPVEEMKK